MTEKVRKKNPTIRQVKRTTAKDRTATPTTTTKAKVKNKQLST